MTQSLSTALAFEHPVVAFERLTDASAASELLRKRLPEGLGKPSEFTACHVRYARCRTYLNPASWHKSFLCVCYEFDVAAQNTWHKPMLYGRAYLQGRSHEEYAALTQPNGAQLVAELDMIVWSFPSDPGLLQLHEMLDTTRVEKYFPYANLPFAADDITDIKIAVVVYRPEQRCILRYDISFGATAEPFVMYAKIFSDHNGERVFSRIQHCYAASIELGIRVARPLGYSAEIQTVWQQELKGAPLFPTLESGDYEAPMAAIGHCLARLHSTDLPMQKTITREARLADASKKARKLAQIFPALNNDLEAIFELAPTQLAALPAAQKSVIHGDVHFGQFLITPDGSLALFDFDEWTHGDPAQDLADLIVDPHVSKFMRDKTTVNRSLPADVARILLTSYRRFAKNSITDAEIIWHARIQLINKAYRSVIQLEPRWQEKVPRLTALARLDIDLGAAHITETML
jgi:Phosphotransferase enzyme family